MRIIGYTTHEIMRIERTCAIYNHPKHGAVLTINKTGNFYWKVASKECYSLEVILPSGETRRFVIKHGKWQWRDHEPENLMSMIENPDEWLNF